MGWISITKTGETAREEDNVARPVAAGEEGKLAAIAQEDYGHKVAVDLINGIIAIGYDEISVQNGTVELHNPGALIWICDETNIVSEMRHLEQKMEPMNDINGNPSFVRTDYLTSLTWRPIWFTRNTNGIQTKVIGAQTTLPIVQGGGNVKKLISIFSDGRLGID